MKDFSPMIVVTSKVSFFFFCNIIFLSSFIQISSAIVHFKGESFSISLVDAPAKFAVPVNSSGICGALYWADPLGACSSLRNSRTLGGGAEQVRFALIARGKCSFEEKVRNAQDAGFRAAIIYDDRENRNLISMIGDSQAIWVHAVFISKRAGEILKKVAQGEKGECCIHPLSEGRAWTVLVISIFSLIIIVSIFSMLLFARNHQIHWQQIPRQSPGINSRIVKNLPFVTFNRACQNDNCPAATCPICLEDYRDGESLRVLPCQHEFHAACVDAWLTKWGTFCPVCKLDMTKVQVSFLCC